MTMVTMAWSCYSPWRPCQDHAIFHNGHDMILPWCHGMIVMFDHGCWPGWRCRVHQIEGLVEFLSSKLPKKLLTQQALNLRIWTATIHKISIFIQHRDWDERCKQTEWNNPLSLCEGQKNLWEITTWSSILSYHLINIKIMPANKKWQLKNLN